MLTYNTQLKKLILPEYGRNIQRMIDHCMTIEDRKERTDCAFTIVDAMYRLFPHTGDAEEYRRKLWDHLAIMSDFSLDIDWPYDVILPDSLNTLPDPLPLPVDMINNRQYGKNLEIMVDVVAHLPEDDERSVLIMLLANHMKKTLVAATNDNVEDEKIFKDLRNMSHGLINLNSQDCKLHEFKTLPGPKKKKKK